MTEGVTLLTLTIKIKYYIEDIIFKNFKKLKKSEGVKITKKKVFINKISKTFDIFGQQSQKKKNHIFLGAFIWNHPTARGSLAPTV